MTASSPLPDPAAQAPVPVPTPSAPPAPAPAYPQQVVIPSPYGYAGPPASSMSGLATRVGGLLDRLSASVARMAPQIDRDTIRPALKVVIWLILQVGGIWLLGNLLGGGGQQQGSVDDALHAILGGGR